MPWNPNQRSRRRRALALALVLAGSAPCSARAEDGEQDEALAPPRFLEESAPALGALPAASAPASVLIELTVDEQGRARDPVVLSSAGAELDAQALAAVGALRFEPARRGEQPIAARIPFRFDFTPALPAPPRPPPPPAVAPAQGAELSFEVQGERPPRETTVYTLAPDEIQKLPGVGGDPLRAVEALPGVARPPTFNPFLIVRGAGPNDSGIFVDGIQIPLSYHFGGFSSVIPSDSLQKFELRPGNFGAEFGRAMGGALELELRAPRRDRAGGLLQVDPIDGRFAVEGPLGRRTRFMVAARRSWVDAWLGKLDDSIKEAPVYYDGQASLEHDLTRRTRLRLFFVGSDDRLKLLFESGNPADPGQAGKLDVGTRFTRLALRVDTQLSDAVSSRLTLSWGTDHIAAALGTERQRIDAHTLDARGELRARVSPWLTGVLGLDTQLWRYDVALRIRPYPPDNGEVYAPGFAIPTRALSEEVWLLRPALYTLLELTPTRGLRVVPGVRADYARDTGDVTVDPRLSARYELRDASPRTTLKAGMGLYTQPPRGVESVLPFGSRGVRSSRALHASLGVEQELVPGLTLSLDGFYKHLYDLVVARAAEQLGNVGASFTNSGGGRIVGVESMLRLQRGRWYGLASYTAMRSERRDRSGDPYRLFLYDQTHVVSAIGNLTWGRGWSLGARWRYVTGMPTTPILGGVGDLDAGVYAPIAGSYFAARVPAFHQLDLRVEKQWEVGPSKLTLYFELRNAYNRKNSDALGYNYDYSRSKPASTLPIMPVLGLRGEL